MHNSVHVAKVTGNFTLQSTPWGKRQIKNAAIFLHYKIAKLRCS